MTVLRAPTLAELVVMIRDEPDERRRARLEEWYWAKGVDHHGTLLNHWYREEHGWLVERQRRLAAMRDKPALGAHRSRRAMREAA